MQKTQTTQDKNCYTCGKPGHFTRDCPMKQDNTMNKSSSKYTGRLNIHIQEEEERDILPRIMVEVQGKKMLVLVDTGASADFIDEDLIKEIDPITYEIETGNGTIECTRQAIMKIGLAGRMLEVHMIPFLFA